MIPKKAYVATFGTETNSFIEFPTTIKDFAECCLYYGGQYDTPPNLMSTLQIYLAKLLEDKGYQVSHGLCAFGKVSGVLTNETFEHLSNEIFREVQDVKPDVIALFIHGAMISVDYQDAEGQFLETLRNVVGPKTHIGAVLDLHVNLSDRMLNAADLLIGCKEYPHDDFFPTCDSLINLLMRSVAGELNLVTRYYDCRLIGLFGTKDGAMKGYVDLFRQLEHAGDALQVWAAHGFPWSDTVDTSFKVVVTTNNNPDHAENLARIIGKDIYADRAKFPMMIHSPEQIPDISWDRSVGPLVLGDIADNPMGGAPGDATFLLNYLIASKTYKAAFSAIYDPDLVQCLMREQDGATVDIELGGKISMHSGRPIEARAVVLAKFHNKSVSVAQGSVLLGDSVVLRIGTVDIVVCSIPVQVVAPSFLSELGLEPRDYDIVAVKSTQHFTAYFATVAGGFGYISTPGALVQDYKILPYRHLDPKTIWPIVADPLGMQFGS